ncbi:MAG: response regulator [Balneolales bacterium]|nr:response regulator [Balneolales bacterium]
MKTDDDIKNVLIVEDEFILQMMIEKMIQKMGHTIVGKAKSGEMAIELVKKVQPDVILMDIKIIGDYDGIETVLKIREFSNAPVLYLSGNTDPETMKRALATKPMRFIVKPFEFNDLKNAIDNSSISEQSSEE